MLYCSENGTEADPIRRAALALADGTVLEGVGFGAVAKTGGEVVFNTGIVGYPESITDPSYRGQILCQTYPLIGNYGVDPAHFESDRPQIAGYVVSELCARPSHATSRKTLDDWLRENGVPGIAGIDTRALTKKLRVHGVMTGLLAAGDGPQSPARLRREAREVADPNARDLVAEVTTPEIRIYNPGAARTVVVIDCGVKMNIIRSLVRRGVAVVRVPADTDAGRILSFSPRGVVISNGPGDPAAGGGHDRRGPPAPRGRRSPLRASASATRSWPWPPAAAPTSSSSATAARTSPASRRAPSAATSPARTTASPWTRPACRAAGAPGSATPTTARTRASATSAGPSSASSSTPRPARARPTPSSSSTASSRPPDEEARTKVLLLGSGALKIGEAGEFDYSGSQAIKALKEEGLEVVLINPNIATIQTSEAWPTGSTSCP